MGLIQFVQQFDFDWLILSMKAITFLGNEQFYLLVLPVLIWCWRKDIIPLVIILLVNFWINYELKEFFHLARPEGVGLIMEGHYGFPSGHAQGAMVLWGYLAWLISNDNRKSVYAWFGTLIFFIGFSRIYLGVHFPSDVIGGWTIGFLVLFTGIYVEKTVKLRKLDFPPVPSIILMIFIGLMLAIMAPSDISVRTGGMLAGLVGGLILEGVRIGYKPVNSWGRRAVVIIIGVAGIMILRAGIKAALPETLWADWLRYSMMGLWIGFGAPWLFSRAKITEN